MDHLNHLDQFGVGVSTRFVVQNQNRYRKQAFPMVKLRTNNLSDPKGNQ